MKRRALLSTVWFCEKVRPGHSCIWGAPASSLAMSSGCSGTAPASSAPPGWGCIVNVWRWCFLFSNWRSQGLWQARSHPDEYSVQLAVLPVREFACEKQFPLVKGQLPTAETRHSLHQHRQHWRREQKALCCFPSSCKGHFSTRFACSGRFDLYGSSSVAFLEIQHFSRAVLSSPYTKFHYV